MPFTKNGKIGKLLSTFRSKIGSRNTKPSNTIPSSLEARGLINVDGVTEQRVNTTGSFEWIDNLAANQDRLNGIDGGQLRRYTKVQPAQYGLVGLRALTEEEISMDLKEKALERARLIKSVHDVLRGTTPMPTYTDSKILKMANELVRAIEVKAEWDKPKYESACGTSPATGMAPSDTSFQPGQIYTNGTRRGQGVPSRLATPRMPNGTYTLANTAGTAVATAPSPNNEVTENV